MMGGSETVSGDKDAVQAAVYVPIGWHRRVEGGRVIYVSPSGTSLTTLEEVKTYLLTDGTCKCGLECPLIIHKVFNFNVGAKVEQHNQLLGKAEQDMTKLCNHRRKVVAMAALCRSMQASQLPCTNFHPADVSRSDCKDPKKEHSEHKEEERGLHYPKPYPGPTRVNNIHPNPSSSPRISPSPVYSHNGSPSMLHTSPNYNHPLDGFRRFHYPPFQASSNPSPNCSSPVQNRIGVTPNPHNTSQGQLTPKTPETPGSPWLGTLSSPPSSCLMTFGGVRGAQPHPNAPLSPSPSSPAVHSVSSEQRSRHLSASPSSLPEQGGSSAAGGGGGLMGSNLPQRRKSASSSPHSPVSGGSPNRNPHIPKYRLEDILEQLKNSGNGSTKNHHVLNSPNPSLLSNQSSNQPNLVSSRLCKAPLTPTASAGPLGLGLNSSGPANLPLGPLLKHHCSHQSKLSQPVSFPASSLLSAAAKAQLANHITQSSNLASSMGNLHSSLDVLKETQLQQKVTNSTLHNSITSPSASSRLPHTPLAAASAVLFPPSYSKAQSLVSSSSHLPPTAECSASHRKRQRRSPTALPVLRDTQPLVNGMRKATPDEAVSAAVINLSSSLSSFPSSSHSCSTSAVQNQTTGSLENHQNFSEQVPRFPATRPTTHVSRHRPNEALDFTTGLAPTPFSLDPPSQPLSALLHLLSVQNAQATASNSALAHSKMVLIEGSGHTKKQSPPESSSSTGSNAMHLQSESPASTDNTKPLSLVQKPLSSPPFTSSCFTKLQTQSPQTCTKSSPVHKDSDTLPPKLNLGFPNRSPSRLMPTSSVDANQPGDDQNIPVVDAAPRVSAQVASPPATVATESGSSSTLPSVDTSPSHCTASAGTPSSPKPLDLSNHVLALLAASSSTVAPGESHSSSHNDRTETCSAENSSTGPEEPEDLHPKSSLLTSPTTSTSPSFSGSTSHNDIQSPNSLTIGDSAAHLPLAEAFPFMNQEQLLQLLSSTGGLPSLLDPAMLASLPLTLPWLGGQHAQIAPGTVAPQNLAEPQPPEQQPLLIQETQQENHDPQQKPHLNNNPLFPLLPLLSGAQGELPLNLLGLLQPLPTSATSPGQEPELTEKSNLQALLMASMLAGQQQASLLPLSVLGHLNQISLEVPLQQSQQLPSTLEGLSLEKTSSLLDPSALTGSGLLDVTQALLPISAGAENHIQALQSLFLPATLPPPPPAAFLSLSPALLTAALSSAELPPPNTQLAPSQQTQHTQPQVTTDAGGDTLIPVSLQGKDNPLLQQLIPTLLNPSLLGDLAGITGLQNMVGIGAGSILLSPVQSSALGMIQSPDGAINLLNNIQLNFAPPSDGEKPGSLQEAQHAASQEDIPACDISSKVAPSPGSVLTPSLSQESTVPTQRGSEGRTVIDPYTSFMDTIYTSFLQVSAKEQEDGAHLGPSDPSSPFCALPPVSFPLEHHVPSTSAPTLPQASSPVSLSPRRACSLHNPDLSRLSLEAAAHSPAQGTPKHTEDVPTSPRQRKAVIEGHTNLETPLAPIYLEEAKTDCTGPSSTVCPFLGSGVEKQGQFTHSGYLRPADGCGGGAIEETTETLLHSGQGMDQPGAAVGVRRGRKRKQTLQNVLEDFRDMDATALEETKATTALLKPGGSVRGRRRRGTRSQRQ